MMANNFWRWILPLLLLPMVAAQDKGQFTAPSSSTGPNVFEVGERLNIAWDEYEPYTLLSLGIFQPRVNLTIEWLICT